MNELTETTPLVRLTINIKNKNGYVNDTINFTRKICMNKQEQLPHRWIVAMLSFHRPPTPIKD